MQKFGRAAGVSDGPILTSKLKDRLGLRSALYSYVDGHIECRH